MKRTMKIIKNKGQLLLLFVILTFSIVIQGDLYAGFNGKYFDRVGTKIDYRGVRTFTREIRSTARHMSNNWDYYIVYFKKNGQIRMYKYISSGNIIFEEYYIYKNSRLRKLKTYSNKQLMQTTYLGSNSLKVKKVYAHNNSKVVSYFNRHKKLVRVVKYDGDGEKVTTTKIKYNRRGKRSRLIYYDEDGEKLEYVKYFYNRGLKVRSSSYTPGKKLLGFTDYLYNRLHRLEKALDYDSYGKLLGSKIYEYNERGKIRYIQYFDRKGRLVIR